MTPKQYPNLYLQILLWLARLCGSVLPLYCILLHEYVFFQLLILLIWMLEIKPRASYRFTLEPHCWHNLNLRWQVLLYGLKPLFQYFSVFSVYFQYLNLWMVCVTYLSFPVIWNLVPLLQLSQAVPLVTSYQRSILIWLSMLPECVCLILNVNALGGACLAVLTGSWAVKDWIWASQHAQAALSPVPKLLYFIVFYIGYWNGLWYV